MFTCFCLKDQFLYSLCSFQRSLCWVRCKIKKEMNKNPVFWLDDGSLVAVVMVYEVLKTKMHDQVQRCYPDVLYVLSKVQLFFFFLNWMVKQRQQLFMFHPPLFQIHCLHQSTPWAPRPTLHSLLVPIFQRTPFPLHKRSMCWPI